MGEERKPVHSVTFNCYGEGEPLEMVLDGEKRVTRGVILVANNFYSEEDARKNIEGLVFSVCWGSHEERVDALRWAVHHSPGLLAVVAELTGVEPEALYDRVYSALENTRDRAKAEPAAVV